MTRSRLASKMTIPRWHSDVVRRTTIALLSGLVAHGALAEEELAETVGAWLVAFLSNIAIGTARLWAVLRML